MPAKSPPSKKEPTRRGTGPSEVAPGLYVGGWKDALRFAGTRFCVLDEAPDDMPPAKHIPIYDDATGGAIVPNLDRLARAIAAARAGGEPVLVFCGHGIRRSPLGMAWYLHRAEHVPLDRAYERIRAVRPKVEPARAWIPDASSLGGA
jgi:protein-tyrosine phosphatase